MERALEYEDLRAFERRLMEVVSSYSHLTFRWRFIFTILANMSIIGIFSWLEEQRTTNQDPLTPSFFRHPIFRIAALFTVFLIFLGKYKLVFSERMITSRTNRVLKSFHMACDDTGRLRQLRE